MYVGTFKKTGSSKRASKNAKRKLNDTGEDRFSDAPWKKDVKPTRADGLSDAPWRNAKKAIPEGKSSGTQAAPLSREPGGGYQDKQTGNEKLRPQTEGPPAAPPSRESGGRDLDAQPRMEEKRPAKGPLMHDFTYPLGVW